MLQLVDIVHINTVVVLTVGGLMVHWIRRVNKSFRDVEHLRMDMALKMAAIEATLHEHTVVSEQVWEDVGRRLNLLERVRYGGSGNGH